MADGRRSLRGEDGAALPDDRSGADPDDRAPNAGSAWDDDCRWDCAAMGGRTATISNCCAPLAEREAGLPADDSVQPIPDPED